MKKLLIIVMGLSSVAFAGEGNFICIGTGKSDPNSVRKIVLKQIGDEKLDSNGDLKEGVKYEYAFRMYTGKSKKANIMTTVDVEREDVMVKFLSRNYSRHGLEGIVYLDEPTDSWLEINGGKFISFDCRKRKDVCIR